MTKNKRWIAGAVLAGLGIFATATPALADRWDYGARSDRREYREYREDLRDLRDAQREYYEDRRNGASRAELARVDYLGASGICKWHKPCAKNAREFCPLPPEGVDDAQTHPQPPSRYFDLCCCFCVRAQRCGSR